MTTITSVEQLRELQHGEVLLDLKGHVYVKMWSGERSRVHINRYLLDLDAVALPAQTLHPRTISAGDVERLARSLWIDDAPGRPQAGHEWDSLSMFPPVYERYRSLARAALTALGFEVTE